MKVYMCHKLCEATLAVKDQACSALTIKYASYLGELLPRARMREGVKKSVLFVCHAVCQSVSLFSEKF